MDYISILKFMSIAEKLKCNLRHSWTSSMRQESVAEHSWQLCLFSWIIKNDFPDVDMEKVLLMCLFHDIGEALTGDIPAFLKTDEQENDETEAVSKILGLLNMETQNELVLLFEEIQKQESKEAKLFKALDKLEAVIQHNEAPLETWIPLEYDLNLTYGNEEAKEFSRIMNLRDEVRKTTIELLNKINHTGNYET